MDFNLNIYTTKFCTEVERVATVRDVKLSTGVCTDILEIVNIDLLSGGLESLSDESFYELVVGIVANGYPYFIDLVKELFELSEDETRRLEIGDVARVIVNIIKYSFGNLVSSFVNKKQKNVKRGAVK